MRLWTLRRLIGRATVSWETLEERETLKGYEIRSRVESSVEEEPSLFHVKTAKDNSRKSTITELVTHHNRTLTVDSEGRISGRISSPW